jgi:multiple sugar transport system permease protein/raffinose/stachyose/melibiose transport system permease protein
MAIRVDGHAKKNATRANAVSRKPWGAITLFIAPVIIYYAIFTLYPIVATFYYSLHSIVPEGGKLVTYFVGWQNFARLLADDIFLRSVNNTIIWAVVGPILEMVTATTLAFIVYFNVPFHRFYRAAWFAPMLVSGVIVGLVFKWIFNYDWGLLNVGLRAIGLDDLALNWLGRRDTPLWAVIFVHYWATFGYSFVLMIAGLSAIPGELIEAARIDGASTVQASTKVLLPLLMPTFLTVLILSFMGKMRAFHIVWVLTGGGPMHFSETVATYVQKRAFGWSTLDLGYPSAMAVVWFGVVIIGVALINRWLKTRTED